jgi:sphinganine-1-phosphate aldolase
VVRHLSRPGRHHVPRPRRRVGREAFVEYFAENALGGSSAFPSVKGLEQEVVAMALDLFRAPAGAAGFMSTGGSESILLAVHTARRFARARRGDARHHGNLVASETLHPAFDKAAALMDLEIRRVPVRSDLRADVAGIEAAIDADTILLVGSAPNFPYGMVDPIGELSEIAQRHDLWLHVDACVGGYLAPFAQRLGRPVPDFDFSLPGVRSISADLHKYGFCAKGASTLFFRDQRADHRLHRLERSGHPSRRRRAGGQGLAAPACCASPRRCT